VDALTEEHFLSLLYLPLVSSLTQDTSIVIMVGTSDTLGVSSILCSCVVTLETELRFFSAFLEFLSSNHDQLCHP
jgi:hypothetical protein